MEIDVDGDIDCKWCTWNYSQKIGKKPKCGYVKYVRMRIIYGYIKTFICIGIRTTLKTLTTFLVQVRNFL